MVIRACLLAAVLLTPASFARSSGPAEAGASPPVQPHAAIPSTEATPGASPASLSALKAISPPLAVEESIPRLEVISAAPELGAPATAGEGDKPNIPIPERREVAAIIKEFNSIGRRALQVGLDRAGRYINLIKSELLRLDLPLELAALPLIESHYSVAALSASGAAGLWQFIPTTARNYKLRVDWWVDERLDPLASTRAAASHLRDLYAKFGDWDLVLAAYNSGAGCIDRATVGKDGAKRDFWEICSTNKVAAQTKRYVPKFYAALAIMTSPIDFGFKGLETSDPLEFDLVTVDSPVALSMVARRAGIDGSELDILNPALKRGITPPGDTYDIRVPKGFGEKVAKEISAMAAEERLDFKKHKIASGDTISRIAKKYGSDAEAIVALNRLADPRKLKNGTELVIPVTKKPSSVQGRPAAVAKPSPVEEKTAQAANPPDFHVVAAGETLFSIARRYGIAVKDAMAWNGLDEETLLRPGMKLMVGGKIH